MPGGFIGAKRYLNSRFLETGTFEEYLFNKDNVSDASQEEADMFHQLMNRSTFLIGNL